MKIRIYNPTAKVEGFCPHCNWSWMEWDVDDVEKAVIAHIESAHTNPTRYDPPVDSFPGQGVRGV